jgi:NhaP-type Na+/H+ or K+/H+ antiporter
LIGAVIGYAARKVLRLAEKHESVLDRLAMMRLMRNSLIDHESFLAFGVALTFFTLGAVGILGSDDILCCFVVGNSFTWDDWFRVQSEDHSFQDVIDQLLNSVSLVASSN